MGGKSKSTNDAALQFQMQQAEEAKQKEAERQARLTQGKTAIDDLFAGGGFDDSFYNKYKGAELNYTLPQLQDQYAKQKEQTTYDLARAGTLRSTAAGKAQANLELQNATNEAAIRAKADADTAALRQGIQGEQQTAYNQLYATEDPAVAANSATSSINAAQLSSPALTPLGDLFKPLVIGSMGALSNVVGNYNLNKQLGTSSPFTGSGSEQG
jgi:hypothetical protein